MLICKVIGNVWATKKDEALEGKKLMVVQQTDAHGEDSVGESFALIAKSLTLKQRPAWI